MLLSALLRSLQAARGKLLLLAFCSALSASAQSYSPAPAIAGTPVTFTAGFPGSPALGYDFIVLGPAPSASLVTGGGSPIQNGSSSFTTTLPAGKYELEITAGFNDRPNQSSFYYFTVYGPNQSDLAALQGQYTFQLSGEKESNIAGPAFALGSFTADGKGNVTAGILDTNTPGIVQQGVPLTGTYQLSANGAGTVTLNTTGGATIELSLLTASALSTTLTPFTSGFSNPPFPAGIYLPGAPITGNAGVGIAGGGSLQQVLPPSPGSYGNYLPSTLNASLHGFFTGVASQNGGFFPLSGASQFTFASNGTVTDRGTLAANGTTFDYSGLAGTYTPFDPTTGRSVMTLPSPTADGTPTGTYAVYQLNSGNNASASILFLSLTPETDGGGFNVQSGAILGRGDQQ